MTDTGPAGAASGAGEPDPQRIAAAAEACPSVARLHPGPAAAYLPGKRVPGVSITEDTVTVHVDLAYPATAATLGRELRAGLAGLLAGRQLAISVEDIVLPGDPTPDPVGSTATPALSPPLAPSPGVPL